MGYGRSYARRPAQSTGPSANKYDAGCSRCGRLVPAGTGILTGSRGQGYEVRHSDARWVGSPVSGRWAGGCDDAKDQPVYQPVTPARRAYARTAPRYERCTHEDYPCCGCGE